MSQQLAAPDVIAVPPLKRRTDWVSRASGVIALVIVALVLADLARNKALDWPTVGRYMFDPVVLAGVWMTIQLTVFSMLIGLVLSILVAQMRLASNRVVRTIAIVFVWLFRAIPLMVLLIVVYNIGLVYPEFSVGVPFTGQVFVRFAAQDFITPMIAAVFAFSIHESAYGSEIIRAALLSVPRGQVEAAEALGMTKAKVLRRIVLPQALKMAIPPLANNVIQMVKGTAVVAFIAVPDLLYSVQRIYLTNYKVMPLLVVATIWYLVLVSILSIAQYQLEVRLGDKRRPKRPRRTTFENRIRRAVAENTESEM